MQCSWRPEEGIGFPWSWELGTKLWFSARGVHILNLWAISLAPLKICSPLKMMRNLVGKITKIIFFTEFWKLAKGLG